MGSLSFVQYVINQNAVDAVPDYTIHDNHQESYIFLMCLFLFEGQIVQRENETEKEKVSHPPAQAPNDSNTWS